jgi:hypothetical protein
VLCGESREGLGAEVREIDDCLLRVDQPLLELRVRGLEADNLSLARVGNVASLL